MIARALTRMGAKSSVVEARRYHDEAWTLDQVQQGTMSHTDCEVFRLTHMIKIPVEFSYNLNYTF